MFRSRAVERGQYNLRNTYEMNEDAFKEAVLRDNYCIGRPKNIYINHVIFPSARQTTLESIPEYVSEYIPSLKGKDAIDLLSGMNFLPALFMMEQEVGHILLTEQREWVYPSYIFGLYVIGALMDTLGDKPIGEIKHLTKAIDRIKKAFKESYNEDTYALVLYKLDEMISVQGDNVDFRVRSGNGIEHSFERVLPTLIEFAKELKISNYRSGERKGKEPKDFVLDMTLGDALKNISKSEKPLHVFSNKSFTWLEIYTDGTTYRKFPQNRLENLFL